MPLQARIINDGAKEHLHHAATVIQAAYRGHTTRRIHGWRLAAHVPNDPNLRQKHFQRKVATVTAGIIAEADRKANDVSQFLVELEASMHGSKQKLEGARLCPFTTTVLRADGNDNIMMTV